MRWFVLGLFCLVPTMALGGDLVGDLSVEQYCSDWNRGSIQQQEDTDYHDAVCATLEAGASDFFVLGEWSDEFSAPAWRWVVFPDRGMPDIFGGESILLGLEKPALEEWLDRKLFVAALEAGFEDRLPETVDAFLELRHELLAARRESCPAPTGAQVFENFYRHASVELGGLGLITIGEMVCHPLRNSMSLEEFADALAAESVKPEPGLQLPAGAPVALRFPSSAELKKLEVAEPGQGL